MIGEQFIICKRVRDRLEAEATSGLGMGSVGLRGNMAFRIAIYLQLENKTVLRERAAKRAFYNVTPPPVKYGHTEQFP